MLIEEGHSVVALSKKPGAAHGIEFKTKFVNIANIDTVSMYISPEHQPNVIEDIIALNPKRVIFNPGTENIEFSNVLRSKDIVVENACTLVLLRIGAF